MVLLVVDDKRRVREFINDYIFDSIRDIDKFNYYDKIKGLYNERPSFIIRGDILDEYRNILKSWLGIDINFINHMVSMRY